MSIDKHQNPDGTYDGAAVLSELSGLKRSEVFKLWERVKANNAKLDACPWHEFEEIPRQPLPPRVASTEHSRYRCKNCGGEVNANAYHWHEQGRRARP